MMHLFLPLSTDILQENCWFMCSLLQDQLVEFGEGSLVFGKHIHFGLDSPLRLRVLYRAYSTPALPLVSAELSSKWRVLMAPQQLLDLIRDLESRVSPVTDSRDFMVRISVLREGLTKEKTLNPLNRSDMSLITKVLASRCPQAQCAK